MVVRGALVFVGVGVDDDCCATTDAINMAVVISDSDSTSDTLAMCHSDYVFV